MIKRLHKGLVKEYGLYGSLTMNELALIFVFCPEIKVNVTDVINLKNCGQNCWYYGVEELVKFYSWNRVVAEKGKLTNKKFHFVGYNKSLTFEVPFSAWFKGEIYSGILWNTSLFDRGKKLPSAYEWLKFEV